MSSRPPRKGRSGREDDIPLARRSRPLETPRQGAKGVFGWLRRLLLVGGTAAALLALLLLSPLRSRLAPPPVAGLAARLSADGRLLGHFPYPEAPAASMVAIAPGQELRSDAARALLAMQRAAAADGVDLRVLSAFRSIALQNQLFFDVKAERNQSPRSRAKVSAPPGFSEHSTGYAVDLGDGRQSDTNLSERFEQTAAYRWLAANANRHHFSLSFPRGNPQGVSYEPWHWRYEGSAEALKLFESAQRLAAR
ncbi:MAG: D-alanyl-D-alanine carboxypeptidase family protein [Cyanobium sp.]